MTKQIKISLTIFIILFLGLGAYAFHIYRQRNIIPTQDNAEEASTSENPQTSAEEPASDESPNSAVDDYALSDEPEEISDENLSGEERDNYLDVSKSDCNGNCKNFSDPDDLKYCQQVCGISPDKKDSKKSSCDALEDLEKDYCLKDSAISTKNIIICTEINDSNIQRACKNRLTQDLIESGKL